MNTLEWRHLVDAIENDIDSLVRAQQVRGEIDAEVRERDRRFIEEDYIYADALGEVPRRPRSLVIDGVTIDVTILHRQGIAQRDIKGADLMYEIRDQKFVLIQYKTPDQRGRVYYNSRQFQELIAACPSRCNGSPRPEFWPRCGAWFCRRADTGGRYLPACWAESVFGQARSRSASQFEEGVNQDTFYELFARCWIGARTLPARIAIFTAELLNADRVLFNVTQDGLFGP